MYIKYLARKNVDLCNVLDILSLSQLNSCYGKQVVVLFLPLEIFVYYFLA